MLAMDVNDNACFLNKRAALEPIASKLAPTDSTFPTCRSWLASEGGLEPCRANGDAFAGKPASYRGCSVRLTDRRYRLKHCFCAAAA